MSRFLGIPSPFSSPHCFMCFALFSVLPLYFSCDSVHLLMVEPGQCQPLFPRCLLPQLNQATTGMCFQDFFSHSSNCSQKKMHLPNMSTAGKSVVVAVYDPQSKPWHQYMHEALKRKELKTSKTIHMGGCLTQNTPGCFFSYELIFRKEVL